MRSPRQFDRPVPKQPANQPAPEKKTGPRKAKQPKKRRFRPFYWLAVLAAWGIIALILGGLYLAHDLPDVTELKPAEAEASIVVLARDGSTVATYGDVYGEWLKFEEIPEPLLKAVIATEDRRFFTHVGFDLKGLFRASWRNLTAGRIVEGGSTITQQVAKNLFLSSERTFRRKLQELMIAFLLETKHSKQEIITLYLNRMYFGARSYGIDAAAHTYFGHSARRLSLAESAMIVGLLKAPSALAPNRNYEQAVIRSQEVLGAMVGAQMISAAEAESARANPPEVMRSLTGADSRYFADWVVDRLPREITARGIPLVVETTLDPMAQTIAERALRHSLNSDGIPGNISQGAIALMTVDGRVLAMVGGKSYGQSQFNRAVQAKRQPGSAFKLFVYLAALDAGIDPDSTMRDTPITLDGWSPTNYSGKFDGGEVTLRRAFAESINSVAVKLSERADRHRVVQIARRLGITTPLMASPSIALGTSEVSLIELTAAYGIIGNGGYGMTAEPIFEVRSAQGEVLYRRSAQLSEQIVAPEANAAMRELLAEAVESGTGRAARFGGPAAGKTGTSQDFRDAWFVGYSGDFVAGVWLGNDNGAPMTKVSGGGAPARLWGAVMRGVSQGIKIEPIGRPKLRPALPGASPAPGEDNQGLFERLRDKLRHIDTDS